MEHARYHLVFEGFKPETNKTAVSFSLKDQLNLTETQLADMMAGRRTVLRQNMDKDAALKLGKELTQAGLVIKAQALAVNQKNSPDDVRKHLLQGGLDQYFASKYRHPEEELDTRLSLIILAAFAVATYILLPIIGVLLMLPLLSFSTWGSQFIPALIQLIIALILFAPAAILWPKPAKPEGLPLEKDTEELLWQMVEKLADHLSAPKIDKIILVENPVLNVHQTPLQWIKGSSTLELGLPILEALNMQQFVGMLAMRMTPLASTFYSRTWGLFVQWYNALRNRYKPWAMLLNNWVLPMHEHQNARGTNVARELVGFSEALRLQRIEKRFALLYRDWPEFVEFCSKLRVRGKNWSALVAKEAKSEKKADEVQALFRIESPALWVLSTTTGYQKVFARQGDGPLFEMAGVQLWQQFQRLIPLQDRMGELMIKPEALVPPTESPKKKKRPNALALNKQASDVLSAQKAIIEQALGMHEKPKKLKDVNPLIAKWRASSAPFWPEDFNSHKMMPLAKSVFLALQTLQQIDLWAFDDGKIPAGKHAARDKQVMTLFTKWLDQTRKLPALPLISSEGDKLFDQVSVSCAQQDPTKMSAADVLQRRTYWLDLMIVYWTFIAGQILKPKTFADEMAEQA